jgi:hypothetical protein
MLLWWNIRGCYSGGTVYRYLTTEDEFEPPVPLTTESLSEHLFGAPRAEHCLKTDLLRPEGGWETDRSNPYPAATRQLGT